MIKLLGAIILVLCGGVLGFGKRMFLRRRIALLNALDSSLSLMTAEIELCGRPLPEIFALLALRGAEETGPFFASLAEKCGSMSAAQAWDEACRGLELPQEALRALSSASAVLGAYDAQRQSAEIGSLRRSLVSVRENLSAELHERGASYPVLGACLAGIFAMLMI